MSGNNQGRIGSITDIDKLPQQQLNVLRAIKREGEKHLKYYEETMRAFKHPELRVKTFDTKYYEQALPIINELLNKK